MLAHDLVDIWRLQNPESKQFTWSQKNPLIKRRLDYWLVSDSVQDLRTSLRENREKLEMRIRNPPSFFAWS